MPLFSWQQLSRSTAFWPPSHGKTIKLLTLLQMLTTSSLQQMLTATYVPQSQAGKGIDVAVAKSIHN